MTTEDRMDQFQLLEEKVDALIKRVESLRGEKTNLTEQVGTQEKRVADLSAEVAQLRGSGDEARRRITALLEKIERLEL